MQVRCGDIVAHDTKCPNAAAVGRAGDGRSGAMQRNKERMFETNENETNTVEKTDCGPKE